jgi:RNA polymerase sigma factor (sigma-70 family)
MTAGVRGTRRGPHAISAGVAWSDDRLVAECLRGNEQAWAALIARYKNLIYSIPLKYGATPDDAADVFQAVCLELFSQLPRIRRAASLPAWLISVTTHQAYRWKRQRARQSDREGTPIGDEDPPEDAASTPAFLEELEREQAVRRAIERLSPRCQEIVRLLFYEQPPVPYADLAGRLGLATGSIGFIRGRCLKRLHALLKEAGL